PHNIVWIFAIGWVAAEARSAPSRALLSAVILATVPGYFGEPWRELFVAVGLLMVVWVPTITLPRSLVPIIGRVAAASLYIYLTHWQVFPPLRDRFGPSAALVGALAAGVLAWTVTHHAVRLGGRVRQREARVGAAVGGVSAERASLV
ncbi:MAG: AMP-dependent synthetase, partial [Acidimicrobiales bacterium]